MASRLFDEWTSPEGLERLRQLTADGATDAEIAKVIGCAKKTLYEWRRSPEFREATAAGKAVADQKVEDSLFRRACGYDVRETTTEYSGGIEVAKTVRTKHIPPDTTAIIFWLKNRRPDEWRDRQKVELEQTEPVRITLGDDVKRFLV